MKESECDLQARALEGDMGCFDSSTLSGQLDVCTRHSIEHGV